MNCAARSVAPIAAHNDVEDAGLLFASLFVDYLDVRVKLVGIELAAKALKEGNVNAFRLYQLGVLQLLCGGLFANGCGFGALGASFSAGSAG